MENKILIVEDDVLVGESLEEYLVEEGYKVRLVNSGEDALQILSAFNPSLVIVDIRLPGIDGNEFIVRAFAQNSKLKFVIHTGYNSYQLPEALINIGLNQEDIFLKPIKNMDVFCNAIEKRCG